jgi:hypothetical protein
MSALLESLLKGADPRSITEFFFWLIIVNLVLAMLLRKTGKAQAYVNYSATLLTSLGILGTFIGIVVGLLDFNAEDIDGSISLLLAGLKTAFITSLVGMSASIVFKVLGAMSVFIKTEESELQDIGADDVYRAINEQGRLMLESSLVQQGLLADLKRAIVGSEDDTLVSQVKLLRADMNDNHKTAKSMDERLAVIQTVSTEQQQAFQQFSDKLWLRLQDVADTIAKSATEEVIKALKDVITDFNNNLIEQFGDNFKALDESVKKLVIWQEKYGQQVDEMVKQYTLGVAAIQQTETSVANISDKSAHIPETMQNLQNIMQVNQEQVETLGGHLGAFKEMRDHAIEAVPVIHDQVKVIVGDIGQAVETVKTGFVESTTDFKNAVKETNQSLTGTSDEIGKQNEAMREELSRSSDAATEHYKALLVKTDSFINQHLMQHDKATKDLLANYSEKMQAGVDAVKTGLETGTAKMAEGLNESSKEFMAVIKDGATEFKSVVHDTNDSLLNTSNEIGKQTGVIREHLQDTVTELNANVRDMATKVVDESKTLSTTLQDANKQTVADISQVQQIVVDGVERMQKQFENILEEIFQAQTQEVEKTFKALEDEMKNAVGNTGNAVDEQIKNIEDATAQQITLVMNEMGRALSSISKKFTADYSDLVSKMSAIVNERGR